MGDYARKLGLGTSYDWTYDEALRISDYCVLLYAGFGTVLGTEAFCLGLLLFTSYVCNQ